MTTDIRARLIERMKSELDRRTANLPDSIPIAVPVGPLADAIIDEMSDGRGVPLIPDYDHEVWSIRRWTEPFTSEEALEGGVRDIAVFLEKDRVVIRARSGIGPVIDVSLPADDAEQLLIAGLATVKAARDVAS